MMTNNARVNVAAVVWLSGFLLTVSTTGQNAAWYKSNDRGNRYEGTRDVKVSAPIVSLIGFHRYRVTFPARSDAVLSVRFFLSDNRRPVHITAREIFRHTFYWMEAKPQAWKTGWNTFGPWPVREVLRPKGVGSENLGVVIRCDNFVSGGGCITPAIITANGSPTNISNYTAYVVPGRDLSKLTYSLSRGSTTFRTGNLGPADVGVPVTVRFDASQVPDGNLELKISATAKHVTGEPVDVVYTFQHRQLR